MTDKQNWNFDELRALVGPQLSEQLNPYLSSFVWKLDFADYHASKCLEIENAFHKREFVSFGNDEETHKTFFELEGHFLAFAHMLHSAPDTLAQVFNLCFLRPPLTEDRVSFKGMRESFEKQGSLDLKDAFDALIDTDEFRYLDAFVNVIKHRRLVPQSYKVKYEEKKGAAVGFVVQAFAYHQAHHERWVSEVVASREVMRIRLVALGNKLNESLKARA